MAFNYANGTMYEIGQNMYGDNILAKLDIASGILIEQIALDVDGGSFSVLEITTEGEMHAAYGLTIYRVDTDTYEVEEITSYEVDSVGRLSMYYKHNQDAMYACSMSNNVGILYTVDMESWELTLISVTDQYFYSI